MANVDFYPAFVFTLVYYTEFKTSLRDCYKFAHLGVLKITRFFARTKSFKFSYLHLTIKFNVECQEFQQDYRLSLLITLEFVKSHLIY